MIQKDLINSTVGFVKSILNDAEGGHDWWHIYRVWNNTKLLLKNEKADSLICELAALLHDIGDHKFHDDIELGPKLASDFLKEQGLENQKIAPVIYIMKHISFSKTLEESKPKSIEFQIVQDADRLDAIGAIGIARAFNYGGFKNRKIYDPEIKPLSYNSAAEYTKSDAPTINHFYEKLLLLKDMMNTETGKKIAQERHRYMEKYLDQFYNEWDGKI